MVKMEYKACDYYLLCMAANAKKEKKMPFYSAAVKDYSSFTCKYELNQLVHHM
jgi:hypothetical protein